MSLNVDNCPKCGRIYMKNSREFCPACLKEIDLQYEKCIKHLRDHRGLTLQELSEATEVSTKQIIKFIREGRISMINAPNLSYPCEVCGAPIRDQLICDSCRQRLARDVNHVREDEQRQEEAKRQDGQLSYKIRDRLKRPD